VKAAQLRQVRVAAASSRCQDFLTFDWLAAYESITAGCRCHFSGASFS
jgi:hypothetical protein